MKKFILLAFITFITTSIALAHSGRTNKEGCHNDRKAGTYHCH